MYGDEALKLVAECKRAADKLTQYNHGQCDAVIAETQMLVQDIVEMSAEQRAFEQSEAFARLSPQQLEDRAQTLKLKGLLHQAAIKRNKRCLLAYHKHRLDRLKANAWNLAAAAGASTKTAGAELEIPRELLSPPEREFSSLYRELVGELSAQFPGLDLTASLQPPKELFINVRALRDCGEVQTESGTVRIVKDTQHYLRRSDVEWLITLGHLRHVD